MQTVVDINKAFEDLVANHLQLKQFYTFSLEEIDIDKITVDLFPLLYAQCTSATIEGGATTFDYEVIVADLVIEKQGPEITQIYGETLLILQDVISQFHLNVSAMATEVNSSWSFDMPIVADPFSARFNNMLTGWSCSFSIRVPNVVNLCNALYE
tara:strand:+ start:7374 stop:7838 length:465 start_codon:yes stop_codon:yes gene_type:complete